MNRVLCFVCHKSNEQGMCPGADSHIKVTAGMIGVRKWLGTTLILRDAAVVIPVPFWVLNQKKMTKINFCFRIATSYN